MLMASFSESDASRPAEIRENLLTHCNVISGLEKTTSQASAGDLEAIPPRCCNKSKDFTQGTNGERKKRVEMTVPQEINEKGQHHCDDSFQFFLAIQSTSFISLELPELGK